MFTAGCQQLITGQIRDAIEATGVAAHLNMTLIGYGNAQTSGSRVSCQHGSGECQALEVEDCAIRHNPEFSDHWPFILCMEQKGDAMLKNIQACATKAGLDYATIDACYKGKEGLQDLIAAGKRTGSHQYVPWVEINGKHDASADNGNFLKAVCGAIAGEKPAGCKSALRGVAPIAPPCLAVA